MAHKRGSLAYEQINVVAITAKQPFDADKKRNSRKGRSFLGLVQAYTWPSLER